MGKYEKMFNFMFRLLLEDGLKCNYTNRTVKAKLIEICLKIAPLVEKLDFLQPNAEQIQKEIILTVKNSLDIITFQVKHFRAQYSNNMLLNE